MLWPYVLQAKLLKEGYMGGYIGFRVYGLGSKVLKGVFSGLYRELPYGLLSGILGVQTLAHIFFCPSTHTHQTGL